MLVCEFACESACACTFVWPEWGADVDVWSLMCAITYFHLVQCVLLQIIQQHF